MAELDECPQDPDVPGFSACPSPEELLSGRRGAVTRRLTSFGLNVPDGSVSPAARVSRSVASRRSEQRRRGWGWFDEEMKDGDRGEGVEGVSFR